MQLLSFVNLNIRESVYYYLYHLRCFQLNVIVFISLFILQLKYVVVFLCLFHHIDIINLKVLPIRLIILLDSVDRAANMLCMMELLHLDNNKCVVT